MQSHVRILRAILISPAVVPIGACVFALASGFRLRESVAVAAVYGAFSDGGTVILGLPAHFALERKGFRILGDCGSTRQSANARAD